MYLRAPDPESQILADRYLQACAPNAGKYPILNLVTQLAVLDLGQVKLPVTMNQGGERNSIGEVNTYVVSPVTTYGDYALEELQRLNKPWLFWPAALLLRGMRRLMRWAQLDHAIHINNWLLSTNLYPADWTGQGLDSALPELLQHYPNHALVLRSLNHVTNAALIAQLLKLGFIAVPSRQVYLFDARQQAPVPIFSKRHNNKLDTRLLRKTSLQQVDGDAFTDADFTRAEHLYQLLYLDKYSRLNPQYTAAWLRAGRDHGWLSLCGLRPSGGKLIGVVGWFELDGVISAPIVGYDTTADSRMGLYRLLTQLCLQRAARECKLLNFSSGAADFKRLRGGKSAIEYSLVYQRHLPLKQAWTWRFLAWLLHLLAVPLMQKLKL